MKVLFVCGRNRWRSPTAEEVFAEYPGLKCSSAGVSPDAENPVTPEQLAWADVVVAMEKVHRTKLNAMFGAELRNKRVVCLDIPDKYRYQDPALVKLLNSRARRFVPADLLNFR
jgi:predicted protein tyrosine phosphatase